MSSARRLNGAMHASTNENNDQESFAEVVSQLRQAGDELNIRYANDRHHIPAVHVDELERIAIDVVVCVFRLIRFLAQY